MPHLTYINMADHLYQTGQASNSQQDMQQDAHVQLLAQVGSASASSDWTTPNTQTLERRQGYTLQASADSSWTNSSNIGAIEFTRLLPFDLSWSPQELIKPKRKKNYPKEDIT
jgi:hypothetical protein